VALGVKHLCIALEKIVQFLPLLISSAVPNFVCEFLQLVQDRNFGFQLCDSASSCSLVDYAVFGLLDFDIGRKYNVLGLGTACPTVFDENTDMVAVARNIARFFKQTIERVQAVPGVQSVALVRRVPFSGNWGDTPFVVEGRTAAAGSEPRAGQNMISPDYFRALRIPLQRGRDFTDRDDLRSPPVVVVNQTLARTIWPDDDAVGKHIKVPESPEWLTVIGVVGDAKHRTATEPALPQLYLAHYQVPLIFSSLVARWSKYQLDPKPSTSVRTKTTTPGRTSRSCPDCEKSSLARPFAISEARNSTAARLSPFSCPFLVPCA